MTWIIVDGSRMLAPTESQEIMASLYRCGEYASGMIPPYLRALMFVCMWLCEPPPRKVYRNLSTPEGRAFWGQK
jgi:hypothetical protein